MVLLTLISLHSLVLLTSATVVLELAVAHEHAASSGEARKPMMRLVGARALRRDHPSGAAADPGRPAVRAVGLANDGAGRPPLGFTSRRLGGVDDRFDKVSIQVLVLFAQPWRI